jgi:CRP/FNR family transcriptional regulator, cyclic AMP receptor protein
MTRPADTEPADRGAGSAAGSWFAALPASQRTALQAMGRRRSYRSGSTLFQEGDSSDWVVLLSAGRVRVTSVTADGRTVVLAVASPGELVGELSALDGQPRSATATALDAVVAQVVPAAEFREFLQADGAAVVRLLVSICGRLRNADRRMVEFVALDSTGRVAARLVELADRFGVDDNGNVLIDMPITQDDLAGWTGSSREAVAKALRTLRSRGLITTARRSITVVDPEALRARAT